MKTLSRTFWFVVFGVIVMVVVVSCCVFPSIPDQASHCTLSILEIRREINTLSGRRRPDFDNALDQVCGRRAGTYCLYVIDESAIHSISTLVASALRITSAVRTNCTPVNIRTVKVTKSKVADNIANGQSAVNDPNAMLQGSIS